MARETLTIASLEQNRERNLEQQLRLRPPQTWQGIMCECGSVPAHDSGLVRDTAHADGQQRCGVSVLVVAGEAMRSQRAGCETRSVAHVAMFFI